MIGGNQPPSATNDVHNQSNGEENEEIYRSLDLDPEYMPQRAITRPMSIVHLICQFLICLLLVITAGSLYSSVKHNNIPYELILKNWSQDFISDVYQKAANQSCNAGDTDLINFEFPGTYQGCLCEGDNRIDSFPCCNHLNEEDDNDASNSPKHNQNQNQNSHFKSANFIGKQVHHNHAENRSVNDDIISSSTYNTGFILDDDDQLYKIPKRKLKQTDQCYCFGQKIQRVAPSNLNLWKNPGKDTTYRICGKRVKGYNLLKKGFQLGDCKENQKNCGPSQRSDTSFCVPQTEGCPITHFIIDTQPPGRGYKEIALGDGFFLYTSVFFDEYPISEFRITQGNGVCEINNVFSYNQNIKPYQLMDFIKCDQIDPSFDEISQIKESEYFQINKLDSKIYTLPQYPISTQNETIGLFVRNYIQLSRDCRKLLPKFVENIRNVEILRNHIYYIQTFSIMLLFSTIVNLILDFIYLKTLNEYELDWYAPTIFHFMVVQRVIKQLLRKINKQKKENIQKRKDDVVLKLQQDPQDPTSKQQLEELNKELSDIKQDDHTKNWGQIRFFTLLRLLLQVSYLYLLLTAYSIYHTVFTFSKSFQHLECSDDDTTDIVLQFNNVFNNSLLTNLTIFYIISLIFDPNFTYPFTCVCCSAKQEQIKETFIPAIFQSKPSQQNRQNSQQINLKPIQSHVIRKKSLFNLPNALQEGEPENDNNYSRSFYQGPVQKDMKQSPRKQYKYPITQDQNELKVSQSRHRVEPEDHKENKQMGASQNRNGQMHQRTPPIIDQFQPEQNIVNLSDKM